LFNLRHASARNIVECIFGITKNRFEILDRAPQFDMAIQARIPPALAALHNFIIDHDPTDMENFAEDIHDNAAGFAGVVNEDTGILAEGPANREEKEAATRFHDEIAQNMWNSYQAWIAEHPDYNLE
jgi:hypothetical protein